MKILYLYNYKGWAIHNVGKLWLNDVPALNVTFRDFQDFKKSDFSKYDLVWFGYFDLFLYHSCRFYINDVELNKCIVSLHDPLELFPQEKDWKGIDLNLKKWWSSVSWYRWMRLTMLAKIKHVVTASEEMQSILKKNGVSSFLIPTTSSLPPRDKREIKTKVCSILSVFEVYPRKNISMMELIQGYCKDSLKIKFDTKVGKKILSTSQYIKLMDSYSVYICTSFQEGGPIPAMDAMKRGAVVLTTPVGQVQDLIKQGENGFICNTKEEFINKIELLTNDLELLQAMRIKSLETINTERAADNIKLVALSAINEILRISKEVPNSKESIVNYVRWIYRAGFYKLLSLGRFIPRVKGAVKRTIDRIFLRFSTHNTVHKENHKN